MDTFDALAAKWFSLDSADSLPPNGVPRSPFRRVIMFVDNAGRALPPDLLVLRLPAVVASCVFLEPGMLLQDPYLRLHCLLSVSSRGSSARCMRSQ